MRRRTFIRSILSSVVLFVTNRRARARNPTPAQGGVTMAQLAEVILPSGPGALAPQDVAEQFEEWARNYPVGADAGYGYGVTHPRVLGPNPSAHYLEDMHRLNLAARAKGVSFAHLSLAERRSLVRAALATAGVAAIPARPNGQHVATDMMSFFYSSSDAEDLCYNAAIRRSDCRGLSGSHQRPARLT